jgi:nicotinate-nucleotide adenylyltransferase
MKTIRPVIFGGSFDPPHIGHQMACLYLLKACEADVVWLVPVYTHPAGKPLAPYRDRVQMCKRLAQPFGEQVYVSEAERELGGRVRTYDLLLYLQKRQPEAAFRLALGTDVLAKATRWYRWEDVVRLCPIIPLAREGHTADITASIIFPAISSTDVRRRLASAQSVEGLVTRSVIAYVNEHRLYRGVTA